MSQQRNKKIAVAAWSGAATLMAISLAHAQTAPEASRAEISRTEISRGAVIASTCYACHGTYGVNAGSMPSINEISTERMISTLKGFRSGLRASTVMGRHASGYTDEEIVEVANYLGTLRTQGK